MAAATDTGWVADRAEFQSDAIRSAGWHALTPWEGCMKGRNAR